METLFTSNSTSADQLRFRMNRCCRIAEIRQKKRNILDEDSSEEEASSASADISTQTTPEEKPIFIQLPLLLCSLSGVQFGDCNHCSISSEAQLLGKGAYSDQIGEGGQRSRSRMETMEMEKLLECSLSMFYAYPSGGGDRSPIYILCCCYLFYVAWIGRKPKITYCNQCQAADGGFQGRYSNKPSDTCYTFWVGSVLRILGGSKFIDTTAALHSFLLTCQSEFGGFSKYPGELPDIYHSYYGFTAFSLLEEPGLNHLNPQLGIADLAALGII